MRNDRPRTRNVSERQIDLHSYPLVLFCEANQLTRGQHFEQIWLTWPENGLKNCVLSADLDMPITLAHPHHVLRRLLLLQYSTLPISIF
jgi:hypothetical protein